MEHNTNSTRKRKLHPVVKGLIIFGSCIIIAIAGISIYYLVSPFEKGLRYYDNGNYTEAVKWFRKAAERGDADAQFMLGTFYENGEGVSQDYQEAVKWYRKAAEQGNADAQFLLGGLYATGQGVPQDDAEAVKWLRKAAEQGHAEAELMLILMGESK